MTAWAAVWGVVLGVSMLAFALLVIWVAAGGASDIRALFDSIEAQHGEKPPTEPPTQDKG